MPYAYDFLDGWTIRDRAGYLPDDEVSKATVFALANGYMSSRGAAESLAPSLPGVVGHYINGLYDSPTGEILDREMVNLPAWTPLALTVNGHSLDLESDGLQAYTRTLDMRRGLLRQSFRWQTPDGIVVTLSSERLVSMARLHLAAIHWQLEADTDCEIVVRSAIDAEVNNRFANDHFSSVDVQANAIAITTFQEQYRALVMTAHVAGGSDGGTWKRMTTARKIENTCRLQLKAGRSETLTKFAAVYDSRFSTGDLGALCRHELDSAQEHGYEAIREEHITRWAALWASSDLVIEGDDQAQIAIRFCLFHLLANGPHSEWVSISARGLQGQDYWGSVFWDCDIYVLPFFTYTQPSFARRSLLYRYHTLDGARRKARSLGYTGAYYAWQSQETGDETCALYVFDDPRTGQKIRSYFADEQIHISADVVYALWQYVQAVGDEIFLAERGLEVVCEVARFFASRVTYNADRARYELLTVLGPDEYHERVDNNFYTNALAQNSLQIALGALARIKTDALPMYERLCARIGLGEDEVESWRSIATQLFVPEPDANTEVIAQFDGYFALEDLLPKEVRTRLEHPDQYPGGLTGPYQTTQAIKQADVVLLLYLLRDRYDDSVKRHNWHYYELRTAHDSSLSPMAYALVAAGIGMTEWAYRYFMQTAMMDLLGTGPHWNLGVHTAAMGGAWLAVAHGFCHLDLRDDGIHLTMWPTLPAHWGGVRFSFYWHGYFVRLASDGQVTTLDTDAGTIPIFYPGGWATLKPGKALTLKHEEKTHE